MAVVKAEVAQGFSNLPALRQIGLMVGLAASVALGVAVVLWSQKPNYTLLYGNLPEESVSEVLTSLQQAQIPYELDQASGAILVPADDVYTARLKLAGEGLPKSGMGGFEMLKEKQELGISQFMEQARYQRALEIELARTISTMRSVKSARVHLALPKRSAFLRKKQMPSASVVVDMFAGHSMEKSQVSSIVNLVASSVLNLKPNQVTVVDQTGKLLTQPTRDNQFEMTQTQFEHTRKLEQSFVDRIEGILEPIAGRGGVKAQVVAQLDFTQTEQTRESYNPDQKSIRSEQLEMDKRRDSMTASGIPGALTNQPVAGGTLEGQGGNGDPDSPTLNSRERTTRNYELDKTISHTKSPVGEISRISVAVLMDHKQITTEEGEIQKVPHTAEELQQITTLVKEAVGFNVDRGDTINIVNSAFVQEQIPEPLPELAIWQQPWVWTVAKQAMGGIAVLFLIFGVLRPIMRSLADKAIRIPVSQEQAAVTEGGEGVAALPNAGGAVAQLPGPNEYDDRLKVAKTMANDDPARVAQVVKNWLEKDGG